MGSFLLRRIPGRHIIWSKDGPLSGWPTIASGEIPFGVMESGRATKEGVDFQINPTPGHYNFKSKKHLVFFRKSFPKALIIDEGPDDPYASFLFNLVLTILNQIKIFTTMLESFIHTFYTKHLNN